MLNCDPSVAETIQKEAQQAGLSRSQYISQLLDILMQMPRVFTEGSALDEIRAHSSLVADEVIDKLPAISQAERRSIDQTILHLVEQAIEVMEQETVVLQRPAHLTLVPSIEESAAANSQS